MSMELCVLSDMRLASVAAWQEAIDRQGFPLRLSAEISFADLHGALPLVFGDKKTSFECDHRNAAEIIADCPDIAFDHRWKYALLLRWGAGIDAGVSGYVAAAAYAGACRGVIVDFQEGTIISQQRAIAVAHEIDQGRHLIELAVQKVLEKYRR